MNVLVLVLLLVGGLADAQDLPIRLNLPVINGLDDGTCPTGEQLQSVTDDQVETLQAVIREKIGTTLRPALSCDHLPQSYGSGYYWIQSIEADDATQQYCDMKRTCCDNRGGWMRVANLDMTDPNQQCPSGFRAVSSPRRLCGRRNKYIFKGCVSTTFPVRGVEYSRVCGRVIGYQYGTPDGFGFYINNPTIADIDSVYVDGVSLTHGSSPRKHIWTFVCALDETRSDFTVCSCTRPDLPYTGGAVPSFVGQDYFCETGSRNAAEIGTAYSEDPLWDGQGCGPDSTCCNHPLYFCKQLDQPTREDIELRLCANSFPYSEDTELEIIELYVQ